MSTRKSRKVRHKPVVRQNERQYPFPIPSRDAILKMMSKQGRPMSSNAIAQKLSVNISNELEAFHRRLHAMERDGQLLRNRRGLYGLIDKMDMICGRVIGHPEGYGFLALDSGGEDLFIPAKAMRQVLHDDRVIARVTGVDARGRQEAGIIEILQRRDSTIVGRYVFENHMGFVVPEDKRIGQDIFIPSGQETGALHGQMVMTEITQYPTRRTQPIGRVIEVLGEHMAPGMEIEVAIRKHTLPYLWPSEASTEADKYTTEVTIEDKRNRTDLRDLPLVTIDGKDARDYDDAVYATRQGKDWRLVVAIADVAHYVKQGRALDREAYQRGNSVYFPQRVIPMLPEILSNNLCSLNPNVDRLCMVCDITIGNRGNIKHYQFSNGVMRSHARLTYSQVAAMLVDKNSELRNQYVQLLPHLQELYDLYHVLHKVRIQRGAVDFELPETQIIFDENRKIKRIIPLQRNDAHRLIEECMLAANVCAAEFLKKNKVPAPYRIHEGPTAEKLTDLREFLFELGLSLGGGNQPQAMDYSRLISSVSARSDVRLIQTVLLRSLSQAVYSPDNIGHFALGYENYTHFTSPIRRYPDLLVHRAIKQILQNKPCTFTQEQALAQGQHCSMTERRADDAVRDVVRWLKAEFMMDRIGNEFSGIISGVTNFGIFVELADIFIDGLVHVSAIGNDYYHFEPGKHRLVGERTHKNYCLGDPVRVRVVRVDLDEAQIDFELADHTETKRTTTSSIASRKRKRHGKKRKAKKRK